MRSKASFKGHPIHPALIPFPLAFLYGALVFDALGWVTGRAGLWTTGGHLAVAGVLTALVAAVPGLIDYFGTVPPGSTAKSRATKHMVVNLTSVALMAAAVWLRPPAPDRPDLWTLVLEGLSVALITVGGWMGGTLVVRNQIGVDHRYARAGKWNEAKVEAQPGKPAVVARADELEVDQMKLVHVWGKRIVIARTEHGWSAFDDGCTHRGASLADGVLMCGAVQCPWHGSQFDVRTGAVKCGPAEAGIAAYRIEEDRGEIRLLP
jgi:uncharacterized membrane protein/nitrite reductase/ring-hydroxylating ferredoxin subunit